MPNLLFVMIGGAAGAGLRYEVGRWALQRIGAGFPWGTLIVNLAGGLLMGIIAGVIMAEGRADRAVWLLLGVGVLGGFTTFSAFSLDVFTMLQRGQTAVALTYVAASVIGSVLLLILGYAAARAVA
jgi:fluoride exporter